MLSVYHCSVMGMVMEMSCLHPCRVVFDLFTGADAFNGLL